MERGGDGSVPSSAAVVPHGCWLVLKQSSIHVLQEGVASAVTPELGVRVILFLHGH